MRSAIKTVQIASVPERVDSLKQTVESLIDQVNLMFIALNGYEDVPIFLRGDKRIATVLLDNKMTDGAKAYNIEERKGYVFLCDDDLVCPPTYISDMCDTIDQKKCIVTLHGKVYPRPFKSFLNVERNYRCLGNVFQGGFVDVGGTGVMGWHTDDFKLSYEDIKSPNMADIWISYAAKKQGVKIYVMPHTENYLNHTRFSDNLFKTEHVKGFTEQTRILKQMFDES